MVESNISRKVEWTLRADFMAFFVTRSKSDGLFSSGATLRKENIYAVPHRTIKDLMAQLQAPVTMVNANMLRHV
jgi:hypothetical protein